MIDVYYNEDSNDFEFLNFSGAKLYNLVKVQQGSLYYYTDFGIDLDFWLLTETEYQIGAFYNHIINKAIQSGIIINNVNAYIHDAILKLDLAIKDETLITMEL